MKFVIGLEQVNFSFHDAFKFELKQICSVIKILQNKELLQCGRFVLLGTASSCSPVTATVAVRGKIG
jgi:hypothetical protein